MTNLSEKARRMELRRVSGFRQQPQLTATVPAASYLVAHACFKCRRSFKINAGFLELREAACPMCRRPLAWMARSFKAPKSSDLKQWKKVEMLWNAGVRFHSYGGLEKLPETLKEVPSFLQRLHDRELKRFKSNL
ncbi:hypothetical protein OVA03_00435 [Asticcacaulis sp. SL142]|uniref:hypothetical protein n=1 Tax=Asticcacaulis sp. SL142 TaxID=2995155 RepID=UPI00226CAECB|nr:hypothetical protein [Asticcacaulis sp. SL142]WAC48435.1 hypothetical protein OVA03_00435 [Asticcacaulis sp. SL142]